MKFMWKVQPRPGLRGYITPGPHETPPPGLKAGDIVEVVATHGMEITVMKPDGTEYLINHWAVDVGHVYRMQDGRQLREHHPDVIAYLVEHLKEMQARDHQYKNEWASAVQCQLDRARMQWPPPWNPTPKTGEENSGGGDSAKTAPQ